MVCLTFWFTRSSSSPLMPSLRFVSLTSARCLKILKSVSRASLRCTSRRLTRMRRLRASSSCRRKVRSFSALCASLFLVLRTCLASRRRKQTYGSASSVSAPVSPLSWAVIGRLPVAVLLDLQCSYINLAYVRTWPGTVLSYCSSSSSKGRTGGESTAANGCLFWAVSSKKTITSSNWSSLHSFAPSDSWTLICLRAISSSSSMLYDVPAQSSTVAEERMYEVGCCHPLRYSAS